MNTVQRAIYFSNLKIIGRKCFIKTDQINDKMRCFLGTKIEDNLIPKASKVKNIFKKSGGDIKFVEDENLHFTVKFLGDMKKKETAKINTIKNILQDFEPFKIKLKGTGAFPSENYIKVIWIGLGKGHKKFKKLIQEIDRKLSEVGFEEEKNEIVPHLTIGRVKSGKNKEEIIKALNRTKKRELGEMEVNEVTLFKSNLTSEGPIYDKVRSYGL